ncbi:MAG: hypothetical protein AVDCRST_MAG93-3639 [uncultured Chloroflexia bacterium]|uniref:DUF429 domain-containing protein n=1 Tax=uncultured Chloroflexia bacterium TaxID=1672391 RepID=A0A6J4JTR3_9CHLR|nr:MAG: hypothetical protein AVDCRST_MAG93-3639 [uncultured Chloroflexia bacterium]
MFDRFISIDWSGSGAEDQRVNLRVVEASLQDVDGVVVDPPNGRVGTRAWTRAECREWLVEALKPNQPRCLVAMDFGFGYPWGTDVAAFGCRGWRQMLRAVAEVYEREGSARGAAEKVNLRPGFGGHGPYRFNKSRTDFRFYLDNGVGYFRLTEIAIPQAISQWYLGSGGTVGFSSISGMVTLHRLMVAREQGLIDFRVWPQEGVVPDADRHVIVESYPAMYPEPTSYGDCRDEHCRDAWKALQWMLGESASGTLMEAFDLPKKPFGRVEGVGFEEQVRFEGWIFGVS